MRVDVNGSAELQATILALKTVDRDIAKQLRAQSKRVIEPVFKQELAQQASTSLEVLALAQTGRAAVSSQNVTLSVGKVRGRKFSGGFDPRKSGTAVEYGSKPGKRTTYQRRNRSGSGSHKVTRNTTANMRPRNRSGYVFGPSIAEVAPRILSLWVQTTVRALHEALEGRKS